MHLPTPLPVALLAAALLAPLPACSTADAHSVSHSAEDPAPAPEEPVVLPITQPDRGIDINAIPSDAFALGEVTIEGDTLLVTVSYAGGAAEHDFALYWNGITLRSYPGQVHLMLKHDANGDTAEAYLTQTLRFDLSDMVQPLILHIHGHREDDTATVQYGER